MTQIREDKRHIVCFNHNLFADVVYVKVLGTPCL